MSSIHQVNIKLKEQITSFSGELSKSMKKVKKRIVRELIYGILASGSVHLTKISRVLEEEISLHKTHDRLCRNLGKYDLEKIIAQEILEKGAKQVKEESLIIIDPTEIIKPYAKKMEYLAPVRDGSKDVIGQGYWMCQAIATNIDGSNIIPLTSVLSSSEDPQNYGENNIILSMVEKIYLETGYNGTIVFDRGADRKLLLEKWAIRPLFNFIIRQVGNRNIRYKKKVMLVDDLAKKVKKRYRETLTKVVDGKLKTKDVDFGFCPVKLPGCERELFLVVVEGFGKKPMMLLTTHKLTWSRKKLWNIVQSYITRWKIEETIRFVKQSYQLEDIRLLTYKRIKAMISFVLAATYFVCCHIGMKERLKVLASHALKAAKRLFGIPDFNFYCLADGLKAIFARVGSGIIPQKENAPPDSNQLSLF
jgi:hypothetical protein